MLKRQINAIAVCLLVAGYAHAAPDIYEYWLDSDYSSRTVAELSQQDEQEIALSIPLEGLTPGLHCFNFRPGTGGSRVGNLTRRTFYYLPATRASEMAGYETWLDNDYDQRKTVSSQSGELTYQLDLGALKAGLHAFNFRPIGVGGVPGNLVRRTFYYLPATRAAEMCQYETWLDNDYSSRKVTQSSEGELAIEIDLSTLKAGLHAFNFRPIGVGSVPGSLERRTFYYLPANSGTKMEAYQTWLDNDYSSRKVVQSADGELAIEIDLSTLKAGLHTFNFRPFGADNTTGSLERHTFYLAPAPSTYTVACRYAIDGGEPVLMDACGDQIVFDIDISQLGQREHTITFSVQDANGLWSAERTDTFTISGVPLDANEFKSLMALAAELGKMGWMPGWDFTQGIEAAASFEGVRVVDGHVTAFDFSNRGLQGLVPTSMFLFPMLEKIDLSHNGLSGDICTAIAALAVKSPASVAHLTTLDISYNQYNGNVYALAYGLKSLVKLNASHNCFEDLVPAIAPTVTELDISCQSINRTVTLALNCIDQPEYLPELITTLPTILFYNHKLQTWSVEFDFMFTTADVEGYVKGESDNFEMEARIGALGLEFPYISDNVVYTGASGDCINAIKLGKDGSVEGSSFKISLVYDDGDVNLDGGVNVLDLQGIISYIFEVYSGKPFAWLAANRRADDDYINIQDVVLMVDHLMTVPNNSVASRASFESDLAYNAGGRLMISSAVPVAAFELLISGDTDVQLSPILRQMGFSTRISRFENGITKVVGYSLNLSEIPSGITDIGYIGTNSIVGVVMADINADAIVHCADPAHVASAISLTPLSIEVADGKLWIIAAEERTDVDWKVNTPDGITVGAGHIGRLNQGHQALECHLPDQGVVIVSISCDQMAPVTRKILITTK